MAVFYVCPGKMQLYHNKLPMEPQTDLLTAGEKQFETNEIKMLGAK